MEQDGARSAPLFRKEATLYRGSRLGRASIALPLSSWLFGSLLLGTVLAIIGFLSLAEYARKEQVPGYVTPSLGAAEVFPSRRGVVSRVHVSLGERVVAGDPLFSIAEQAELPEGGALSGAMAERLKSQMAHIAAEREGSLSVFDRRFEGLEHNTLTTQRSLLAVDERLVLMRERLTLAEASAAARSKLVAQRVLALEQLRQAQAEVLRAKLALKRLESDHRDLEDRLPALRLQREELTAEKARHQAAFDIRLEQLRTRLLELEAQRALIMVAPIDGTVALLQLATGQPASPQRPAVTIVPEGATLEARLLIPSQARGFVEPGQRVRLKFDAFPHQRFGAPGGVVTEISEAAVAGHHLIAPVTASQPVYLASVELDGDHIDAYGRRNPLEPGMTLSADVILGKQRLISWLLEPLLRAGG